LSILPLVATHVDVYLKTDRNSNWQFVKTVSYALSSFDAWDFSGTDVEGYESIGFSFETNYSPQPFKMKVRAKKIDYFKVKLVNDGTDGAVVLSLTMPTRTGGEVKNRG